MGGDSELKKLKKTTKKYVDKTFDEKTQMIEKNVFFVCMRSRFFINER